MKHQQIIETVRLLARTGQADKAIRLLMKKYEVSEVQARQLLEATEDESKEDFRVLEVFEQVSEKVGGCRSLLYSLGAITAGIMGVPICLASIGVYLYMDYQIGESQHVIGHVTALQPIYESSGETDYQAEISYQVAQRTYTIVAPRYFSNEYQMGQEVPLFYQNEHPQSVIIDNFNNRWLMIIVTAVIGLFLLIMMTILIFLKRSLA